MSASPRNVAIMTVGQTQSSQSSPAFGPPSESLMNPLDPLVGPHGRLAPRRPHDPRLRRLDYGYTQPPTGYLSSPTQHPSAGIHPPSYPDPHVPSQQAGFQPFGRPEPARDFSPESPSTSIQNMATMVSIQAGGAGLDLDHSTSSFALQTSHPFHAAPADARGIALFAAYIGRG